eukprot:g29828.t1
MKKRRGERQSKRQSLLQQSKRSLLSSFLAFFHFALCTDGAQARNCPPLCNFGCGTSLGLCGCSDVVQRLYHPFLRGWSCAPAAPTALPALPHTRVHCLALSGIQGNAEESLEVSFVVRERGQLRQPPPIDDRAVAANKVMDILGFESGRLYSEDSYIVELAKWGFAATTTRIRQATQDLSELTPSSVPPHVTAMLGEVQELFELNSRSAALLNVPNLQSLSAFEGSSFDNTPIRFDPTPELLGMDTAGIEYYLAEKHPSGDRRIKNGTMYLIYITMSKVYDDYVSRYFDFILPEIARKLISGYAMLCYAMLFAPRPLPPQRRAQRGRQRQYRRNIRR